MPSRTPSVEPAVLVPLATSPAAPRVPSQATLRVLAEVGPDWRVRWVAPDCLNVFHECAAVRERARTNGQGPARLGWTPTELPGVDAARCEACKTAWVRAPGGQPARLPQAAPRDTEAPAALPCPSPFLSKKRFLGWLGSVVAEGRRRQALTQVELARAVGWVQRSHVSGVERAHVPVPLSRADTFERLLGLPDGFLVGALVNFRDHGGDPTHFLKHINEPADSLAAQAAVWYLEACSEPKEMVLASWLSTMHARWPHLFKRQGKPW